MTEAMTPVGKLMWEQRLFEISGNWKAAEMIQEKIARYYRNIKERKPEQNEETGSES